MTENRSILLLGIEEPNGVAGHLRKTGHRILQSPVIADGMDWLDDPSLNAVYLWPSSHDQAIEELRRVLARRPDLAIVLVCSEAAEDLTLDAWRTGAADILFPPITSESVEEGLQRALRRSQSVPGGGMHEIETRLRYVDESGQEHLVPLAPPGLTIGRNHGNDLVLVKMNISRRHAEIVFQDGEVRLIDHSKHGTFVNGVRIDQAVLSHGDRIRLGGTQGMLLTFQRGDLLQELLAGSGTESSSISSIPVHGFRQMGMLLSTFRALSQIPLLDDLLNLVVDTAIEVTGAERGFIMLRDEDGCLSFRCARNASKQSLDGASFQTSRRVPQEVFDTGRRVVINDLDVGDGAEDHVSTRRLGVRSICCVPLRHLSFQDTGSASIIRSAETIGVLYVDSANVGQAISSTQIEAFDTLASEAALAINNARLYKEAREKQKLEEELAIAREIQQALLPEPIKALPHVSAHSMNLPCHEVGGDYFDYFELEDGRFGFALGDVAGKGASAALLAAMIQGIFCAQTLLNLPLPAMIANVNCSLARRGPGNRFVTFFLGILDSEGNCSYTNAGHNPPILIQPDGSMHELTKGGMVLGLFPNVEYETDSVRLNPGDHLVLFTDGVVEARNKSGEEFGDVRLRRVLQSNARSTAASILEQLKKALVSFSADAPQHDDITMMVLGYREASLG